MLETDKGDKMGNAIDSILETERQIGKLLKELEQNTGFMVTSLKVNRTGLTTGLQAPEIIGTTISLEVYNPGW